ncbi:EI24 domain-containing protein [Jeongeupia naejangsanensis]|uniref:EI24 domain-containing protein n=1 Tax=Jeongeupia naejangsanensis TaxID=613195 RepID=A0ABS2BHE6_9NEIS|nr:EI24 domain-containing protein [Jeongeupia naejangsanensis]MBM3115032.1 EI24 domain-containing protein [Jeongeupia naejangsanensis]
MPEIPSPNPAAPARPGEVIHCVALGLRDSIHPRLLRVSLGVWLLTLLIMALAYWLAWEPISQGFGAAARFLTQRLPGQLGWVPDPASWVGRVATGMTLVLEYALAFLGFVLGTMLVARIVLEMVLMGHVQALVLTRYPAIANHVLRPWRANVRDLAGNLGTLIIGSVLCMCIPVIGPVLLVMLNAYLNIRGLINDALDGVATAEQQRRFIRSHRWQMLGAGLLLSGVALIPFAALLMPGMLGATACHLGFRWLARQPKS